MALYTSRPVSQRESQKEERSRLNREKAAPATTGEQSADDELRSFGDGFVEAMRRKQAASPQVPGPGDLVDVFTARGAFRFRAVVEEVQGQSAIVRVTGQSNEPRETRTHKVKIKQCRYADAEAPPKNLADWKSART